MQSHFLTRLILAMLFSALTAFPVAAQIDEDAVDTESDEIIEELIVVGTRPGDPADADPLYREVLRQQMMEEVDRMRVEEEEGWRNSNQTYKTSEKSRLVWGYDPKEDRDMRNDVDYSTLPGETIKPATLFRAQF
jgi:hypothetical protein